MVYRWSYTIQKIYNRHTKHYKTINYINHSTAHYNWLTHDTNIQHSHDETNILPLHAHLKIHASQIRQKA